jgi:predicted DNA-binding transcriptional regulator YafY
MYNPTLRLLTLLELLQSHERVSGAELARKLEVSPRSVQRYVAQLQDLGVPVESTRGVGGAYRLRPGFRLPPMMLSADEALAVSLGLRALEPLGLTAFAPVTHAAQSKLERVLPDAIAKRARVAQEAVELEPSPWLAMTDAKQLMTLATAVQSRTPISFAYRSFDGSETQREVEPYSVLHLDGRWYVVGHCRLRVGLRSFRVDRMLDIRLLDEYFDRPSGFDARAYLRHALPFAPSPWLVEVWLDLPLEEAHWRVRPHRMMLEADGEGTVLRCGTGDLEWMAAVLLSLKCPITIRQPLALLDAFAVLAARATAVGVQAAT